MPAPVEIIHEDQDVIVINKPAGLLTSTVPREKRATAIAMLRERVAREDPRARVGVIHRLDRDASGLLVFSKNHDAYRNLKEQFLKHSVERIYVALVMGSPQPAEGMIRSRLVEWPDGSVHSTRREGAGELAITRYKTIRASGKMSLLRVRLETGRKHQIRAHLSEKGWPIVNDAVYSSEKPAGPLMLAAIELEFDHPRTGRRARFQIPLPSVMARLLRGR